MDDTKIHLFISGIFHLPACSILNQPVSILLTSIFFVYFNDAGEKHSQLISQNL